MSATLKLWIAIAVVILGLAGSVWWLSESLATARSDLASTSAQVDALSASVAALQAHSAAVTAGINNLNQRSAENERRLSNALRQESEWATGPVPDPVTGELCKFLSCSPRDPAGEM